MISNCKEKSLFANINSSDIDKHKTNPLLSPHSEDRIMHIIYAINVLKPSWNVYFLSNFSHVLVVYRSRRVQKSLSSILLILAAGFATQSQAELLPTTNFANATDKTNLASKVLDKDFQALSDSLFKGNGDAL